MANIESKLDIIQRADRGEDVRDAIIGALRDINNDVPVDMSNPEDLVIQMPNNQDYSKSYDPPKLMQSILVKQPNSGGKRTNLKEIEITENGVYPTDEEDYDPNKENRYYDKVTVNVKQLANTVIDVAEEITQNGTYSAPADWGADGVRSFTVNVQSAPVSGQFKVQFYDTDRVTLLDQQLVPAYGSATYGGSALPVDPAGKTFVGWNPAPYNITRDTKCYPNFVSQHMVPGEIGADWDVIVADGGAQYPIGSYRTLPFSAVITREELHAIGATGYTDDITVTWEAIMTKVYEGEDGSKSTWLSTPCTFGFNSGKWPNWNKYLAWPDRYERKWMQLIFTKFAPFLQQHIKPVVKYTQNSSSDYPPYSIGATQDYLWSACLKEVCVDNDYWHNDLTYIQYLKPKTYEEQKEKYYDGVPLAIAYVNNANLTPLQRDRLFYLDSNQGYYNTHVMLRDGGPSFSDRRIAISTNKATYTNPETGETESARYIMDDGTPQFLPFIFGFCLV